MNITKQEFEAYVKVQKSGVTNMFDVNCVCKLSGLERDQVMYIMQNYSQLNEQYEVA